VDVTADGERRRIPPPLIRHRIASGRGAMEQPNVTGDEDTPLTPVFWLAVVLTGIGAGLFGVLLMLLLDGVQRLAYGDTTPSALQRTVALAVAGVIGGVGWFLLRRFCAGLRSDVDDSVWTGDGTLSFRRSAGTSVLSEIVVGAGASLGREAAPKLMGGVCGSLLARWTGLSTAQRRLLVACGAGAGLAAVYNVPLGGALFTAEVLVGVVRLPVMLPALACSGIATLVGWVYLPSSATYTGVPDFAFGPSPFVWALVAGPVVGVAAVGFIRLVAWVSHHGAKGRWVLVAPLGAFLVLAGAGLAFPQLFGNGQEMARDAFAAPPALVLPFALFLLKPLVTALCLGSGAYGGLFTPLLSTGAVLGVGLGSAWALLWPGAPIGAYAMIAAAAMLGAGMQAPLAALVLVLELTHAGFGLMIPMIAATVLATGVSRWIDGYSIYSARLAERPR
jgi:CIC family chloride channel protein